MVISDERITVDSNYFIALFNPTDALTPAVLAVSKQLAKQEPTLVISNFIFHEVVTVLSQRAGRKIGVAVGKYILENQKIDLIYIDSLLQQNAWRIFQQVDYKNISFVDCSTLAVMQAENISSLITFDQTDFKRLQCYHRFSLYPIR